MVELDSGASSSALPSRIHRPQAIPDMLTLQHFVLRSEGRKLYRNVLRSPRGVDAGTAAGVREAARTQFDDNATEHDIARLKILLIDGDHSLQQMKQYLGTTRN